MSPLSLAMRLGRRIPFLNSPIRNKSGQETLSKQLRNLRAKCSCCTTDINWMSPRSYPSRQKLLCSSGRWLMVDARMKWERAADAG